MELLLIIVFLFICYSCLIIYYWQAWKSIPVYIPLKKDAEVKISVIIAARNEEKNIGELLKALQAQSYPHQLFEVIVADDHSTDATASIVRQFPRVKLLQLKEDGINSYKKKAIETGIAAATGELIITTDADCLPGENWLQTIACFKEENKSVFIAAPVALSPRPAPRGEEGRELLQIFQSMDFMILQGITGASVYKNMHSMCNGANLAYEKQMFNKVNGFEGVDHIASGDDMLLMYKIWKKVPDSVHYLKSKDVIVVTEPMQTWYSFFNQRIRWASKAKKYDDKRMVAVLILVYLFNLSFFVLLILACWHPYYWIYLFLLWILKTMIELPFMYSVASFFNRKSLVKYFFFFQTLHILYTVLSGLFGQFGKYEWKGRRVS